MAAKVNFVQCRDAGDQQLRANDHKAALESYSAALKSQLPSDPHVVAAVYTQRSSVHVLLKSYDLAKKDAKEAIRLSPAWANGYICLGKACRAQEAFDEAASAFLKAKGVLQAAVDLAGAAASAAVVDDLATVSKWMFECRDLATRSALNAQQVFEKKGDVDVFKGKLGLLPQDSVTDHTIRLLHRLDEVLTNPHMDNSLLGKARHLLLAKEALLDSRPQDAYRELITAADRFQDAESMYHLGVMHSIGLGVRKNLDAALKWLRQAAEQPLGPRSLDNMGIGFALATIGVWYHHGIAVAKDESKAADFWRQSAEIGCPQGQNNYALCLYFGSHGVQRDVPKARDLLRMAAESGHLQAMIHLAEMHAALQDFAIAHRWASCAAGSGHPAAEELAARYKTHAELPPREFHNENDGLAEFQTIHRMANSVQQAAHAPTLAELEFVTERTPYLNQLLIIKRMFSQALMLLESVQTPSADIEGCLVALRLAAAAMRLPSGPFMLGPEELAGFPPVAEVVRRDGRVVPGSSDDADLAIWLEPRGRDGVAAVKHLQDALKRFPNDYYLNMQVATLKSFAEQPWTDVRGALAIFRRMYAALPEPVDDSDPAIMDILYMVGNGQRRTGDHAGAIVSIDRFLATATPYGHRKVADAHFHVGLLHAMNKESPAALVRARKHLEAGVAYDQKLPSFLRTGGGQPRFVLDLILGSKESAASSLALPSIVPKSVPAPELPPTGGNVLAGTRRTLMLRALRPYLLTLWRDSLRTNPPTAPADVSSSTRAVIPVVAETEEEKGAERKTAVLATVDELFSKLADEVSPNRYMHLVVVTPPLPVDGGMYELIAEDSLREPVRIWLFNLQPDVASKLLPGREFRVYHPYAHIVPNGEMRLRIDDPAATLQLSDTAHRLCWACLSVSARLLTCGKCAQAVYCCKECQREDWSRYGHKTTCGTLQQLAAAAAAAGGKASG